MVSQQHSRINVLSVRSCTVIRHLAFWRHWFRARAREPLGHLFSSASRPLGCVCILTWANLSPSLADHRNPERLCSISCISIRSSHYTPYCHSHINVLVETTWVSPHLFHAIICATDMVHGVSNVHRCNEKRLVLFSSPTYRCFSREVVRRGVKILFVLFDNINKPTHDFCNDKTGLLLTQDTKHEIQSNVKA
jgi:hypothetical protein